MTATLRGYVTVRSFNNLSIPVPVQNLVLRNYCSSNGMSYALPFGEHKYRDCYMQLFASIRALEDQGKLGLCSVFMLPIQQSTLYEEFKQLTLEKMIELHCIFEKAVINTRSDFDEIENVIKLRRIADTVDMQSEAIKGFIRSYPESSVAN